MISLFNKFCVFPVVALIVSVAGAAEPGMPKIAVTDLSYEEKVQQYVEYSEFKGKWDNRNSVAERERSSSFSDSSAYSGKASQKGEVELKSGSGFVTVISRGEFRKFIGDVKGELIKSGAVRIVQAKPWTDVKNDTLYDIIGRIKKGFFPGADYVLFGTVTGVEWRDEVNPIQGSNAASWIGSLELAAEFSLINTRTYEVKAAFSALGEGSETRLVNSGSGMSSVSRPRIMQQVSKSLGVAVAEELQNQFNGGR